MSQRDRLMQRIGQAIIELDLGIPQTVLTRAPLRAINQAMTLTGHPRIQSIQSLVQLRRAAYHLESEVE